MRSNVKPYEGMSGGRILIGRFFSWQFAWSTSTSCNSAPRNSSIWTTNP